MDSRECKGTPNNHCCWVNGQECNLLLKEGKHIFCAAVKRAGNWENAPNDSLYGEEFSRVQKYFKSKTNLKIDSLCKSWPYGENECKACGFTRIIKIRRY